MSREIIDAPNRPDENATTEEIHTKRGFPSAVWKSLANNARLSHIFTGPTELFFERKEREETLTKHSSCLTQVIHLPDHNQLQRRCAPTSGCVAPESLDDFDRNAWWTSPEYAGNWARSIVGLWTVSCPDTTLSKICGRLR
jgi:hypothetical protein